MEEIRILLEKSLKELYLKDCILIDRNTKEECINHRLAIYIENIFREMVHLPNAKTTKTYSVDVEYNRNVTGLGLMSYNDNSQKILSKKIIAGEFSNAKEVIPDIIIHERGSNSNNFLCIEAKKRYTAESEERDFTKINGLLNPPFNYKYGCLLEYLPDEEYFCFLLVKKTNQDYEIQRFFIDKI